MDVRRLVTLGLYAGEAVAIAAFGVSLLAGGAWVLSSLARRFGTDPTPMGSITYTFPKLPAKEADAIRAEAARRRKRADHRHAEAGRIETGQPEDRGDNLIKLVERA